MINTTNTVPDKGGIASYTHELAFHLQEKGHEVTVLTYPLSEERPSGLEHTQNYSQVRLASFDFSDLTPPSDTQVASRRVNDPFEKVSFYCRAYRKIALMALETSRFVLKHRPVSSHQRTVLWAITWSPEGLVAALSSIFLRIPYALTAHGKELIIRPQRISGFTYRWTFGHASKIFAVSQHTADILSRSGIPRQKVSVIPNGVRPEDFADTLEARNSTKTAIEKYGLNGKKTMVTVARLVERKGHEKVLQALTGIRRVIPEIRYLIVGDGPLRPRLMELVSQWSLEDSVLFTGEVSEQERVGILRACDLFVMPNRDIPIPNGIDTEGFGIAFLEANVSGKPVIGGKAGGAKEAIVDGKTGLLVNPEDPNEIREAAVRLLLNKELAMSMGEAGKRRVLQEFHWSTLAEAYLTELKGL